MPIIIKNLKIIFFALIGSFCFILPVESKPPPENGYLREYYSNNNLRIEYRYKKGNLTRKRVFHRNGNKFLEDKYKNNVPYIKKSFYENGKLKTIWKKKDAITKHYDEKGKLKYIIQHSK